MAESTIPVDLFNPGQVFACLGFMELADVLLGDAEAGFDWSDPKRAFFRLTASSDTEPVKAVLEYLAHANATRLTPFDYIEQAAGNAAPDDLSDAIDDDSGSEADRNTADQNSPTIALDTFPASAADPLSLPVRLSTPGRTSFDLSHWADGSGRNTFKLYSGNRSAEHIARAMLSGVRDNSKKAQIKYKGIEQLWKERRNELVTMPFDVLTPIGGSFNLDPRGAWTALDAGYSPNVQKHGVSASPVVHLLAACGLEHARPVEIGLRHVRYFVWDGMLPPMLARVALQGGITSLPVQEFHFELALSGKNKIVTFAQQESAL